MKDKKGFGLIELIIVLAVVIFIVDISLPAVKSYFDYTKEDVSDSPVLEIAIYNVKTYVNQVNKNLTLYTKTNGSYYVSEMNITLSGTIPTSDSWVVIENDIVIKGMFKELCGNSYAYISYDGDDFIVEDTNELKLKP